MQTGGKYRSAAHCGNSLAAWLTGNMQAQLQLVFGFVAFEEEMEHAVIGFVQRVVMHRMLARYKPVVAIGRDIDGYLPNKIVNPFAYNTERIAEQANYIHLVDGEANFEASFNILDQKEVVWRYFLARLHVPMAHVGW